MGLNRKQRLDNLWEFVLWFGQFGIAEMIFSTELQNRTYCRLYTRWFRAFSYGPTSFPWSSGDLQILGAIEMEIVRAIFNQGWLAAF
jgi:hypothetical protein